MKEERLSTPAKEVILDQVSFKLESLAFMEFSSMVQTPHAPSESFKKLMATKPVWSEALGISPEIPDS